MASSGWKRSRSGKMVKARKQAAGRGSKKAAPKRRR